MAITLTDEWKNHAFPDVHPAKELQWAENAERHRVETRREIYLEQTSDLRIRRHTSDKNDRAEEKAATDRAFENIMLLAVGSPAYMEAYNNELSFKIDGEEIEITQGELHERATKRAEDLRKQIDATKRRGASVEEIARLQAEADATKRIIEKTDPQRGKVDPNDLKDDLRQAPGLVALIKGEGKTPSQAAENVQDPDAHTSSGINNDENASAVQKLADLTSEAHRSSVADAIVDSPFASKSAIATPAFTAAATNIPAEPNPDQQVPDPAKQTPGFNLG